ncbi:MAG: hypothetical protein WCN27_03285 [Alphaproteobacteria bacterium]
MKSIGILILGLLVGQASAATDYYHTGVYGRAGKHGTDDGSTFPTALPAPDDKLINKHPLIIRPGQMARISDCKKGIPGSHCEIVFTDVGGHTIRKLITEPYVKGDPNEQPHAIRTLIGKAGDPGCLDGTGTKVIIPCGGKDDSGSDSDHESGHKKHYIDGYVS